MSTCKTLLFTFYFASVFSVIILLFLLILLYTFLYIFISSQLYNMEKVMKRSPKTFHSCIHGHVSFQRQEKKKFI